MFEWLKRLLDAFKPPGRNVSGHSVTRPVKTKPKPNPARKA